MSFEIDQTGIYWIVVAGIFLLSFTVQMFYYLYFFLRLTIHRYSDTIVSSGKPVSVIICARNEANNLENNLPYILEQDYPDYEVIVVNDCSEDHTEEVLARLKEKYSNLRSTILKKDVKFTHGKKLALTIGIKSALYEYLLLTDADCRPSSPLWISQMQKHFVPPNEIVLGYGSYERKPGLLNKLLRFDTFFIALQYLSFALAGFPYMGVGRNLAYKRSLFFENKGFASHLKLESGDDDLFINQVASKENTEVEFSHLAHTCSVPPESWAEWYGQKRRHLTTGMHYSRSTRFLLGMEMISRLLFYISFIMLIFSQVYILYIIGLFLIRLTTSVLILNSGMNRLNEKNLLLFSPIFDIFIFLFNTFCVASNLIFQKRSRWR